MINNDVLRRVRYALNLNDAAMMDVFALSDYDITREDLLKLLKKDNEEDFVALTNVQLALFLDGLIVITQRFLGQRNWNHFLRVEIQIQQAINNR